MRNHLAGLFYCLIVSGGAGVLPASADEVEMPRVLDERVALELVADSPQIVTPTGIAVDRRGCVYVVECHTHFPPEGYTGPKFDRIRIFWDTEDGHVDHITTFHEGTTHTMNIGFHPDGSLYVATRSEIFRLRDTDNDDVADERTPIAHLETTGNYPHNGLSGFAFDYAGDVYFGFGENLGADYKLIGSDERTLNGGAEGGNIYRCRADGSQLHQVATGFWNPFHLCFDTFGRLFAVDNDPDSRPPCRLLHIVEDGDYGYRFRNGRKGLHPFTAWNGELPGTLPMVAGTGEAPSGILAYESTNLPEDYIGNLLCTSWGDHRIDRFRLQPHGSSFLSTAEPIIVGGENFRPVGIATAPDGTLYFSDWVDKSYQLHGKGRIWRIRGKGHRPSSGSGMSSRNLSDRARRARERFTNKGNRYRELEAGEVDNPRERAIAWQGLAAVDAVSNKLLDIIPAEQEPGVQALAVRLLLDPLSRPNTAADDRAVLLMSRAEKALSPSMDQLTREALADWIRYGFAPGAADSAEVLRLAESDDPFLRRALLTALVRTGRLDSPSTDWDRAASPAVRLLAVLYCRELGAIDADSLSRLKAFLEDPDPNVRLTAVQWAAKAGLKQFRPQLAAGLAGQAATRRLFEGYLAGIALLDGNNTKAWDETGLEPYMAKLLLDDKTAPAVRTRALRMLRPDHPALTVEVLRGLLAQENPTMRKEVIRTLREQPQPEARELLRSLAANAQQPTALRAEAIVGLRASDPADRNLLWSLADEQVHPLHDEALRSLRGVELTAEEKQHLNALKADEPDTQELVARLLDPLAALPDAPSVDDGAAWLALLDRQGKGDAAAGERIFFHAQAAGCYKCHQREGRGGRVGPDLTSTGQALSRQRLIESVLRPSQEVAPQFVTWTIITRDGRTLTGVLTGEGVDGTQFYADAQGQPFQVRPAEIELREQAQKSIMPDGLHQRLTLRELRDLLAYLAKPPS
ncbi:MAG: PVC-type heme-binding CxxCH protein [Pirellulales bacterium]